MRAAPLFIKPLQPVADHRASSSERLPIVNPAAFCPTCGSQMKESRCKLVCKMCGFYLSCSDFY